MDQMMRLRRLLLGVMLLSLAACAASKLQWVHPSLPSDQWGLDEKSCNRQADRLIEQQLRQSGPVEPIAPGGGATYGSGAGGQSLLRADLTRSRVQAQQQGLVQDCMRQKGYQPARH